MTGGDNIVDSLVRHGIDTIFGRPGVQKCGLGHPDVLARYFHEPLTLSIMPQTPSR